MKIVSSAIIFLLGIQVLLSQDRLASKVIFESGTEKIEGILIRPHSDHIMPAVVFQQGSGNHAFEGYEEEAWGPHRFYIEDVLLGQGYAVFYCNKRGLGNSSGNWKNNDFNGRAEDARAAVAYLRTRPDIDASRIGIAGHSQGGWVAQIAASIDSNIAFVISMAGPTVGVQQQTSMYDSLMYLCNGYPVEKLGSKMKKYRKRKKLAANIGKALPFIKSAILTPKRVV